MSLIWFEIHVIKVTKSFVCIGNIQKKNATIQKKLISGSDCGNRQVKIAKMEIQHATQINEFCAFRVFKFKQGLTTSTYLQVVIYPRYLHTLHSKTPKARSFEAHGTHLPRHMATIWR
jgi:hypothetical protein